jgi:hypothetical protein
MLAVMSGLFAPLERVLKVAAPKLAEFRV